MQDTLARAFTTYIDVLEISLGLALSLTAVSIYNGALSVANISKSERSRAVLMLVGTVLVGVLTYVFCTATFEDWLVAATVLGVTIFIGSLLYKIFAPQKDPLGIRDKLQ